MKPGDPWFDCGIDIPAAGDGVRVDEYDNVFMSGSRVHPEACLGRANVFHPFAVVAAHVTMGDGNAVESFSVVGSRSQARGAARAGRLTIGNGCTFHPHSTVSVGDGPSGTTVGHEVILMTGAHVGHDSEVGSRAVVGNYAQIAGHVVLDEDSVVGALSCVVQRLFVGALAHVLPQVVCRQNLWPLQTLAADGSIRANSIALRRRGGTMGDLRSIRSNWGVQGASLSSLRTSYDFDRAFSRMRPFVASQD